MENAKTAAKSYAGRKIAGVIVGAIGIPMIIVILFIFSSVIALSAAVGGVESSQAGTGDGSTGGVGVAGESLQQWEKTVLDSKNWNSLTDASNPGIDIDGAYGAQCVDISQSWAKNNGWPGGGLNAYPASARSFSNPSPFSSVGSDPKVQAGDILFFSIGHTAVAMNNEDNSGNFKVVEQNYPSPHENTYNHIQVVEIYRLKKAA
jgi:hypothetical protein